MSGCDEVLLLRKPRCLFSLALFALVLLEVHWGAAAPVQPNGAGVPMAKIYPRGSHWAVGHLMGKKSTGDFPYLYEEGNKISSYSSLPENVQQLGDYLQWEEMVKNLLRLLEGSENRSPQILREEFPWYTKSTWEAGDNSSLKDMMDYLLQVMNTKEITPS
uniref:Gastrin-releasing peptide n=1 Tax=Sphenodon punctatus TaxID=8508 RepID=A0A8D0HGP6_SPHPU